VINMEVFMNCEITIGRTGNMEKIKDNEEEITIRFRNLTGAEIVRYHEWLRDNIKSEGIFKDSPTSLFVPYYGVFNKSLTLDHSPRLTYHINTDTQIVATGFTCKHCGKWWGRDEVDKVFRHGMEVMKLWK